MLISTPNLNQADYNNQQHLLRMHPRHRNIFATFIQKCKDAGYPLWIYSSFRSVASQQTLYANYKAGNTKIVAATPGRSFHNYGLAMDVYIYNEQLNRFDRKSSFELYKQVSSIANSLGLRWLGSWNRTEMAHFDYNIYAIKDLQDALNRGILDREGFVDLTKLASKNPNTVNKNTENYSAEVGDDFVSNLQQDEEIPETIPKRTVTRVEKMKANGIWQIIKFVSDQYSLSQYINDASISQSQGSLYNFIQNVVQEPWLEFFGETAGDQFYFQARKEPFDYNGWTQLPIQDIILGEQVLSDELSWYAGPVYSWYQIIPRGSFLGEQNLIFAYVTAMFFEEYADIYGSKPLIHVSNYLNFGKSENKSTLFQKALEDLRYMVESNMYLPFTREGTIVIAGKSNIKRGYRIRYLPTNEVFYVDSVSHRYSMSEEGPDYTSVIKVSRGMKQIHMIAPKDKTTKSYFNLISFEKQEPRKVKEVQEQKISQFITFFFDNDRTYLIDSNEKFSNIGVDLKMVKQIEKFPNLRTQLSDINKKMLDIVVDLIEKYNDAPEFTCKGFVDSDNKATLKRLAASRAVNTKNLIIEAYLKKYDTLTKEQLKSKIKTIANFGANTYNPVIGINEDEVLQIEENVVDDSKIKAYSRFCEFTMTPYSKTIEKEEEQDGVGWKVNKEVFQFFLNRKQNK